MEASNFRPQLAPSLWALGLSAALVAAGFRRRDEANFLPERADRGGVKTEADAPERGWIDVLQRVYARFSEDRVMSIAGGVTFFVLLAIFPAIAALVSIYGLFADPASLTDQIDRLSDILPGGAIEVVGDQMRRVTSQGGTALGVTFVISLAISLWSANSGMKALFDAALALAAIYRFGPDRQHAKWRWITWGSASAALLWLAASSLFSWYAANFGNFNKTYGTLGAAIGLMMWMWISAMVILAGAELDAELECQDPSMRKRPTGGLGRKS